MKYEVRILPKEKETELYDGDEKNYHGRWIRWRGGNKQAGNSRKQVNGVGLVHGEQLGS